MLAFEKSHEQRGNRSECASSNQAVAWNTQSCKDVVGHLITQKLHILQNAP